MNEAAQIAPEAAGVVEPLAPKPLKKNPFTFDVDGVVEHALAKGPATGGRSAPADTRARAERDVESALGKEFGYGEDPPEPEAEADEEPAPGRAPKPKPEPGDETEPPDDAAIQSDEDGTKARPYKRDDLPEDRFIELKVDGERVVVPVRELADSYAGQKAIAARLAKLGEERTVMTSQVEEARTIAKGIRDDTVALFKDPDRLYRILSSEEHEGILQELSKRRWEDLSRWRDDPTQRALFLRQRDQEKLQQQQSAYQEQQQRLQQEQQQRAMAEHTQRVMQPGYDEGLRKAGYPNVEHPEFKPLAQTLLHNIMAAAGRQLATQEDVTSAVLRACQILKLPPGANAPPPKRPVIAPKAQADQPRRKDGKWDAMPKQRRANDADYLMRDMRLRK